MDIVIMLIISILPVYLLGLYVYKKDREKESSKLLTKLFIFGMLSCFPAGIIEVIIEPFFGNTDFMSNIQLFIYASLGIALVEEFLKWIIAYTLSYNHKEFNHVYDAIVYCVFVSLGFACFENIFYVFSASTIWVGVLRAVTAIPGHACDAVIMGNYLGLAKMSKINGDAASENKNKFLSVFMPTLIHGIYDYCLYTQSLIYIIIFFIFIIVIYIFSVVKIKKLAAVTDTFISDSIDNCSDNTNFNEVNLHQLLPVNYCTYCGTKASGNYCTHCGKKLN